MSEIEKLILDRNFSYLQPYFYNNPYALRCELGIGEEDYMSNAKKRALEIYDILFPEGADAFIFDRWAYDYSDSGEAEVDEYAYMADELSDLLNNTIDNEMEYLRFLLENKLKYRHVAVRDLETYDEDQPDETERRHRIVCYADGKNIDYESMLDRQINWNGYAIGFVSFKNECIMSVYDDRGCDVCFATREKMREFYGALKPYFLSNDLEEMQKRYLG